MRESLDNTDQSLFGFEQTASEFAAIKEPRCKDSSFANRRFVRIRILFSQPSRGEPASRQIESHNLAELQAFRKLILGDQSEISVSVFTFLASIGQY